MYHLVKYPGNDIAVTPLTSGWCLPSQQKPEIPKSKLCER